MNKWEYKTPGIPDEMFSRGNVPMTKEEVRTIIISKLRLKSSHIIYDIGAGTGSITVEVARQATKGKIYAIESNEEGIELIKKNAEVFHLDNIKIIAGQAPDALSNLPSPDRVIIGGSGGQLKEIIYFLDNKINNKGKIVIPAVTINTLNSAVTNLEKLGYKLDICNIAVTKTRKVSDYHMFKALNPIYIISAEKGIKEEL